MSNTYIDILGYESTTRIDFECIGIYKIEEYMIEEGSWYTVAKITMLSKAKEIEFVGFLPLDDKTEIEVWFKDEDHRRNTFGEISRTLYSSDVIISEVERREEAKKQRELASNK